ncbi:hypothetical protein [Sphingopyxis alaskensis]|uniref:hypothetical protein n=1 Tax=Sphingopyxis alaskensis TaxID=117207 RepID=UPI00391B2F0C
MRRFIPAAMILPLAACTHVATFRTQDIAPPADGEALKGASYALPMVQFDLEIARSLSSCDTAATPLFAVQATAKESYVEGERFEIDPSALSSLFKTSSLAIEKYEDLDTLKSFNAGADDRTGDILVAVARTGIAIAGATAGIPVPLDAVGESSPWKNVLERAQSIRLWCSAEAQKRLATVEMETGNLERLNARLEAVNAHVVRLKELAAFRRFDKAMMDSLYQEVQKQQQLATEIATTKAALADATGALGAKTELRWPTASSATPRADDLRHQVRFWDSARKLRKFCSNFQLVAWNGVSGVPLDPASLVGNETALDAHCEGVIAVLRQSIDVRLRFEPVTQTRWATGGNVDLAYKLPSDAPAKGLLVREPIRASLVAEYRLSGTADWKTALKDEPLWVPQLGTLRFLKFASGPFENELLSVELRKDGRIEKQRYETKEAALARLGASAVDIAERVRSDAEKREERRRADEKYLRETAAAERAEELARLQYQLDMLTRKKALIEASRDDSAERLAAAELAQINADIAMLKAQIDRIKLTNELGLLQPPG